MCFSFRVSIGTFIVSWGIALYLLSKKLTKNQRHNVIFLMIFSSIQLADAILWLIKMKKNTVNYVITSFIIPFILSLQIFYNMYVINGIKSPLLIPLYIYVFYRFNGFSESLCNNKFSSPIWGSKELMLWEFILFSILIIYPNWWFIGINLLLFPAFSIVSGGGYGSLWCAVANLLAFYYLYKY